MQGTMMEGVITQRLELAPQTIQPASETLAKAAKGASISKLNLVLLMLGTTLVALSSLEAACRWYGWPPIVSLWLAERGWMGEPSTIYEPGKGFGQLMGHLGGGFILLTLFYPLRKRLPASWKLGRLKTWLDVHIFFGVVGFLLVTLHTAGKFGGIVAICYFATLITFASGLIGKYLYVQIPRRINGHEQQLEEVRAEVSELARELASRLGAGAGAEAGASGAEAGKAGIVRDLGTILSDRKGFRKQAGALRQQLRRLQGLDRAERRRLEAGIGLLMSKQRQIANYQAVKRLLASWHRFHLPFTVLLFLILLLHVLVAFLFHVGN